MDFFLWKQFLIAASFVIPNCSQFSCMTTILPEDAFVFDCINLLYKFIKQVNLDKNKYLLLTECAVHTVSYGLSLFPRLMAQA